MAHQSNTAVVVSTCLLKLQDPKNRNLEEEPWRKPHSFAYLAHRHPTEQDMASGVQ
jgi:hypothetical protein